MLWELESRGREAESAEIARAVKGAEKLILATDPDREGEAISWHVARGAEREKRALKDTPIERVTFNAITKDAVAARDAGPARDRYGALVDAYLARRALDYLVGFTLSPVLWRKLPGARARPGASSRSPCGSSRDAGSRDRALHGARILVARGHPRDGSRQRSLRGAARRERTAASASTRLDRWQRPRRPRQFRRDLELATFRVASVEAKAGEAPSGSPPSPPRRCSRKPRASSAWRRPRRCGSRSDSTRASTSAARRSASSPTCGPTASTWRPRRSVRMRAA